MSNPNDWECPDCKGTGAVDPECEACGGDGWVEDEEDGGTMTCPECLGEKCPACNGSGEKPVSVSSPEGKSR
jgi:DnaJ-class molecular chaperone